MILSSVGSHTGQTGVNESVYVLILLHLLSSEKKQLCSHLHFNTATIEESVQMGEGGGWGGRGEGEQGDVDTREGPGG